MYFWIARLAPAVFGLLKIFLANKILKEPNIYISSVSIFAIVSALSCGWLNNSLLRFTDNIGSNFLDNFWRMSIFIVTMINLISIPISIFLTDTDQAFYFFVWICTQSVASVGAFIFWSGGDIKKYSIALSAAASVDIFVLLVLYFLHIESIDLIYIIGSILYALIIIVVIRFTYTVKSGYFPFSRAIKYGFPLSLSLLGTAVAVHIDRLVLARFIDSSTVITYIALYAGIDQVISSYVQVENQKLQSLIFGKPYSGSKSRESVFYLIMGIFRRASAFCFLGVGALAIAVYLNNMIGMFKLPFDWKTVALMYLSISLFRLSQIINKYFEISEATLQFFIIVAFILTIKIFLLIFSFQIMNDIILSIVLAGLVSNLILFTICFVSLNRLKPSTDGLDSDS